MGNTYTYQYVYQTSSDLTVISLVVKVVMALLMESSHLIDLVGGTFSGLWACLHL